MKDCFYFPHDYHARHDFKLDNAFNDLGIEAIGVYWCVIEMLYENEGRLPKQYERFANALRVQKGVIQHIIEDYELFEYDEVCFWSNSVNRRLEERRVKSLKATTSANLRWNKNANALQTQYESNAIKESKVKEKKVNNSVFKAPTLEELTTYCKENNYLTVGNEVEVYLTTRQESNWIKVNGQPVRNWKLDVKNWHLRTQTKQTKERNNDKKWNDLN